jgi:hypothetical protein
LRGRQADGTLRRPVIEPIAAGAAAFGIFYGAALLARRIPILNETIASVLQYAHQGSDPLVLATTLANGLGEEIFFRGGIFSAVGVKHPVAASTAAYTLAATATRNPALVVAFGVMGTLFARPRRASGGIQAPILTHLTWSTLMLRFLPLFREPPRYDAGGLGDSCLAPRNLTAASTAAASATPVATRRPRRRLGASSWAARLSACSAVVAAALRSRRADRRRALSTVSCGVERMDPACLRAFF